jgi:NADH:ubiquinone oxidoreductase subunit 5 (subunit L)/multisubunit Na+/H+ antiporter MnhA subunit
VYQCSDLALITAAAMSVSTAVAGSTAAAIAGGTAITTTAATSSVSTSSADTGVFATAGDGSGAVGDGGSPVGELLQAASEYVHLLLNPVVAGDAGAAAASGAVSPVVAFSLLTAALLKSSQLPVTSLFARSMEGPTPTSAIGYAGLSPHIGVVLLASTLPLWCVLHCQWRLCIGVVRHRRRWRRCCCCGCCCRRYFVAATTAAAAGVVACTTTTSSPPSR